MGKIILICLSFALIVGSCNLNKEDKVKLDEFNVKMRTESLNKAVVQKYLDGLNKNDTTLYEGLYTQLFSPDCKTYIPSGNPKFLTNSESIQSQKFTFKAVPDAHWKIEEIYADGNTVIVRLWTTATNTGVFNGMPPTNKKAGLGNIAIFKLENEKIIEQREEYDQLGLLTQLGFGLVPPSIEKK